MTDIEMFRLAPRAIEILVAALLQEEGRLEMQLSSDDDVNDEADALNELGYIRALRAALKLHHALILMDQEERAKALREKRDGDARTSEDAP